MKELERVLCWLIVEAAAERDIPTVANEKEFLAVMYHFGFNVS